MIAQAMSLPMRMMLTLLALLTIEVAATATSGSGVQALQFVHVSDVHLDEYSQPDAYSPAQFCRNPKFMPKPDRVARTWRRLQADGVVPAGAAPLFVRLADAASAKADDTNADDTDSLDVSPDADALALELARTDELLAAAAPPLASAPAHARFHKPFGWQLCDSYPASVAALINDAASVAPNPDFVVLTGDWCERTAPRSPLMYF